MLLSIKLHINGIKMLVLPKRGFYKSYVEQTIIRYAQNRKFWKEKFELI
mgnify:CR=1 FL=1